jgi:hypothetical protein
VASIKEGGEEDVRWLALRRKPSVCVKIEVLSVAETPREELGVVVLRRIEEVFRPKLVGHAGGAQGGLLVVL